ncbi:MAG: GerW family sporulation protein [Christensenellales bacterium]|nr:GerW family sporulation protein [Christensenellales bacterium]
MEKHPIESLMGTSMESIREMVDVNTVVGDAVQTQDGSTIIPISKVSFGFVAGGGEYGQPMAEDLPFAGGAGAGVSVQPMGFLVCSSSGVRLLSASCASPMERIVEMIPQALDGLRAMGEEEKESASGRTQVRAAYQE